MLFTQLPLFTAPLAPSLSLRTRACTVHGLAFNVPASSRAVHVRALFNLLFGAFLFSCPEVPRLFF
eukprot:922647-Alexandrium_andersonii.AAC.1